MMEQYKVIIKNGNNEIAFVFGNQYLADALRFVSDAMETSDSDTQAIILKINEEDI